MSPAIGVGMRACRSSCENSSIKSFAKGAEASVFVSLGSP